MIKITQPEKKFRAGQLVATIWKNKINVSDKEVEVYSVTLEKNYKDKDDKWQVTNSFKTEDLPKAGLLISKSYEYISLKE